MDFLREEVENLKKLGYSWELEKHQIEEAIMKAIADKNGNIPDEFSDEQVPEKPARQGCCKYGLKVCGAMTLVVMIAALGCVTVYNNYLPFEVYVNKVVGDLNYPVLRRWRHMVLPLHRFFDIQSYSMAECLINNPWFVPDEPDCSICEDAKSVLRVENVTNFNEDYVPWGNPTIITDVQPYVAREYTIENFYDYYLDHKDLLDTDMCEVSSLDENVDSIEDYFKLLEKLGPETPNIRWKVCYGEGLRALRKYLPRPYFVETEGALEKYLMMINNNEEILPIPTGQYANSWVAQVTGSSDMEINPIAECNTTCSSFNVTLNKGEVLYLNQDMWYVDIVGNPSDEQGIVLLSSFA
ncbi:uncharacterized protein LOC114533524 [Dendronephthya gigantea]|uniref:uncharacterized protein LOC114533524 n=1 Tax=Dendronephthya gigantea TaxID=151771 RepID=UPI00106BFF2A|nr:uncharacterized protein LOC114533524 [Dendronephthya gigantea]